ncbi:CUB domain-containing protein 1 isoform X3 [Narcine bancroftii]|uniref:CUB domain-containing protein 1 isoform X3 n=1 Tax=Narcine bancroftii TaxID=1343680 RepID=UPI0038319F6B
MPGGAVYLVLLLSQAWFTGAEPTSIIVDPDMSVNISSATGRLDLPECQMCVAAEQCSLQYHFHAGDDVLLNFTCTNPEDYFIMEVKREIAVQDDDLDNLIPRNLPRLNTTYIWELNVPYNVGVKIGFHKHSLRQTDTDHCPDLVKYSVKGHVRDDNRKEVPVGIFCRNGTIHSLKVQGRTIVILEVPWMEVTDEAEFQLFFVLPIKKMIEIKLREEDGISVKFKQVLQDSKLLCICKIPVTSNCTSELQLNPGDHVNISSHFQCDRAHDIIVESTKIVLCEDLSECPVRNADLELPALLATLPLPLQSFRWVLEAPPEMTVELATRRLKLQQVLPGQSCSGNLTYKMSTFCKDEIRSIIGFFCPGGTVELIQATDSMTLELLTTDAWQTSDLDISLSFVPRVTEDYIMKVIPEPGPAVHLLTPNWELGMPDTLTASWDISVPEDHVVELSFLNKSMPLCEHGHVIISVDEQWDDATLTSFRETDALPTLPISLAHRFWLNVSNCKTSQGHLKLTFHILVKEYEDMETLIISAAAAGGLVLIVAIIVVVCCIKKRRQRRNQPALAIYNPGVKQRAHRRKQGKTRQDNESHIYAVINEDRMYSDYFYKDQMPSMPEVDVYRPFQGPMGNVHPGLPPPRGHVPTGTSAEDANMVANELYTFTAKKQDTENREEMVSFLGNAEKSSNSQPSLLSAEGVDH